MSAESPQPPWWLTLPKRYRPDPAGGEESVVCVDCTAINGQDAFVLRSALKEHDRLHPVNSYQPPPPAHRPPEGKDGINLPVTLQQLLALRDGRTVAVEIMDVIDSRGEPVENAVPVVVFLRRADR